MIPAQTRYVTLEGTTVMVAPRSADEAKAALKELRHKKKELTWQKKSLLRDKKAAEARKERTQPSRGRRKTGFMAAMHTLLGALTAVPRLVSRSNANADIGTLERQCAAIDETLHNIDSAIIQVQGKLLHA